MRKVFYGILIALIISGGLAWANRVELMLYIVKKKSQAEYTVAPNRKIAWKRGQPPF